MIRAAKPHKNLRASVTDARGRQIAGGPAAGLPLWLPRVVPRGTRGDVAVAIISDNLMRALNQAHRGVNRPTDVLSFPAEPGDASGASRTGRTRRTRGTGRTRRCFGDIAIARGVASRQAKAAGHSLATEIRILALHGVLHLLGYDHEADQGEMERVEDRLRRRAGLPAGLIVRVTRSRRSRHA